MFKKMMLLAVSAAAMLAFAIPSIAQADVVFTENDERLANGTEASILSTDTELMTGNGTLKCEEVTLHGKVAVNGFDHVELEPVGEATTTECFVTQNGFPVTITGGGQTTNLTLDTWGQGEVSLTFTARVYSPLDGNHQFPLLTCHYSGTVGAEAVSGTEATVGGILNGGACGNGTLSGSFSQSGGTGIVLDYVSTE